MSIEQQIGETAAAEVAGDDEISVPLVVLTAEIDTRWTSYFVLLAVALPPLRPAAFFCAVVPPCFGFPPDPDF
jgi:hypothetical protein